MLDIILFDGECNLCNYSVQFILKRDKKTRFHFAALQSEVGQKIVSKYRIPENVDSVILVQERQCYYQSSAALRICKHLTGGWKLLYGLIIIPKPLRDYFYGVIAKNRYKWFGKRDSCMLPSPEIRNRFL